MLAYNVSWAIASVFIGMTLYVLDRWTGTRVYRGWYNLTHKDVMDPALEIGFLHNRKAKYRFAMAFGISLVLSLLSIFLGHVNPAMQIITFFVMLPCLMVGFYLGPAFFRLWLKKDLLLEKVDDIESGKLDLAAEVKHAAIGARDRISDMLEKDPPPPAPASAPAPQPVPPAEPVPQPPPPEDPEKLFRKFVDDEGK